MATKPTTIGDVAILRATGKNWNQWRKILVGKQAETLQHKEIARWLHDEQNVPHWWCQMLTVRFEQEIGRRQPGEVKKGEYNVGVSVTRASSMDEALAWWLQKVESETTFNKVAIAGEPRNSQTSKWRYWRAKLADGTAVYVNVYQKAAGKAGIQLSHERLKDAATGEGWRNYWKEFLNQ